MTQSERIAAARGSCRCSRDRFAGRWRSPRRRASADRARWAGLLACAAALALAAPTGASAAECANEAARLAQGSTYLPDCRAYEMVSPAEKNGSSINGGAGGGWAVASQTGGQGASSVLFGSYGTLPGGQDSLLGKSLYLGRRTASGWTTDAIGVPLQKKPSAEGGSGEVVGASAGLSEIALTTTQPISSSAAGEDGLENLYVRGPQGAYTLITDTVPTGGSGIPLLEALEKPVFVGASADFSHVLFQAKLAYVPGAPSAATGSLYEWHEGKLSLADILPGGEPAPAGVYVGTNVTSSFGYTPEAFTHPISEDGSRVFFVSVANHQLYVRANGSTTVQVSAPEAGGTEGQATFQYATPNGAFVLFTDTGRLTSATSPAGTDLYEYDVATGRLTDLSVDANPADKSKGAAVQGVIGASNDGSYVYFAAEGELVPHPPTISFAQIYLWHEGRISYVAPISSSSQWTPSEQSAFVNPAGTRLLIQSTSRLTSYENDGQQEVYRYDAQAGGIACISCNPSGAPATGSAGVGVAGETLESIGKLYPWALPHPMSDSGERVFFETTEALVKQDTNEAMDVYEWENGVVHLISNGTAPGGSYLGDVSASGNDAYFVTRAELVPQDEDPNGDIYDARVGGGMAAQASAASGCSGAACRAPVTAAPSLPEAVSITYQGPGNLAPASAGARMGRLRVRLIRRAHPRGAMVLSVASPGRGRIAAWGRGVRRAMRRVAHAGRLRVRVRLGRRTAARLRRRHEAKVKIHVRYVRQGGGSAAATLSITLKEGSGR